MNKKVSKHYHAVDRGRYEIESGITVEELKEIVSNKNLYAIGFEKKLKNIDFQKLEKYVFSKNDKVELYVFHYVAANTSLEFLKYLPSLKRISFNGLIVTTEIKKIKLSNEIQELSIAECNIEFYEILKTISPKLKKLTIGKSLTKTLNLDFIGRFSYLKRLSIANHTKGIEEISKLNNLEEIVLRSTSLPNINFLRNLNKLWSVDIKLGGIKDFSILENLPNIKHLELWLVTGLNDISFISKMTGLQNIHLESLTNILELPSLAGLTKLRRIKLMNLNGLRNLNALKTTPRLRDFFFTDIKKLQPTDLIPVLESPILKELYIYFPSDKKNNEFNVLAKKYGKTITGFSNFKYEK